jgi:8-oxo-dGTP pyrophosphatase MutT (NUDIX family)
MLDLDPNRTPVPPRDAATLIVLRDADAGLEVFCVERHPKSGFLGGAIVFPGGKVDVEDGSAEWNGAVDEGWRSATSDGRADRAQRIAGCREALEEAAILPVRGGVLSHEDLLDARARAAAKEQSILAFLLSHRLRLNLDALHPFARWVTPAAEARRYDTRFYVTILPPNQRGAHDQRETTSSFWATPAQVLSRFDEGRVQLFPPTHRTLELLARAPNSAAAIALATTLCLDPICPRVVPQETTMALVLPGDREHEIATSRVPGRSRFVLRQDRWLPEDAPKT